MDSFVFDNVTAEKARAMRRYNRLRSLANAFRFLELLLTLLFLAWAFERVPFLVKISGEFIFKLGGVVASPLFVFLVCNVIIVTLISKSAQEEIIYQDKEIISEPNTNTLTSEEMEPESESDSDTETDNPRVYRRSKSENLPIRETEEQVTKELRRSEIEKCRKIENTDDEVFPEDELSNVEFQRTIEDLSPNS
ncbi:putative Phosphatidic acid phosphatase family protein [Hibiscus syriacus]|uniref:Phosphatidic acid phosphatase family protein n=1 Tax=Hibiscus syriacus TaxID=106335 RepID=A0A6A2XZE0_HIBSY|nr:putative Phosphatidic acid phosphatase family protein [Hibiscus syriacus]